MELAQRFCRNIQYHGIHSILINGLGIVVQAMKRFRSPLLLALGLAIGLPVGWCLRGRSVAAKEALLHNLVEIEKSRQQWETETNVTAGRKP